MRKAASYEKLFPELHEPHPTRTLEVKDKIVPAPRWSLCWSALELYVPKSAEHLATLRASRERNRAMVHDSGSSEGMGCRAKWAWTATVT